MALKPKKVQENCRRDLLAYQKYFRESKPGDVMRVEYIRAIYVLRTVLGISWNIETDKYLGNNVKL